MTDKEVIKELLDKVSELETELAQYKSKVTKIKTSFTATELDTLFDDLF